MPVGLTFLLTLSLDKDHMRKFHFNIRVSKRQYTRGFLACVLVLALVRCVFPGIAEQRNTDAAAHVEKGEGDSVRLPVDAPVPVAMSSDAQTSKGSRFFNADGSVAKHRILSVPHFGNTFPDQNDVQLLAANKWGVKPVNDLREAEQRKAELVFVDSNPYFFVDKLNSSIPYLVPRASILLQDIGRAFYDSLQVKGVPLHQIIITSVLRSKDDVAKLRGRNLNAMENSCHLYGTTFDICYNRYKTVEAPGEKRRAVRNDTLKWVLSEVLRDMREQNRCYVKYEVKQGCFHITVN